FGRRVATLIDREVGLPLPEVAFEEVVERDAVLIRFVKMGESARNANDPRDAGRHGHAVAVDVAALAANPRPAPRDLKFLGDHEVPGFQRHAVIKQALIVWEQAVAPIARVDDDVATTGDRAKVGQIAEPPLVADTPAVI